MKFFRSAIPDPSWTILAESKGALVCLRDGIKPTLSGGMLQYVRRTAPALASVVAGMFFLYFAKPTISYLNALGPLQVRAGYAPLGPGGYDRETGLASWYGSEDDGFQYQTTANGETMMPDAWTCAHRTLPFGTIVEVKNLSNGRSAILRVNDRGPYIKGRIVDLSMKGAQEIGLSQDGVAEVSLVAVKNQLQKNNLALALIALTPKSAPFDTAPVKAIAISGQLPLFSYLLNSFPKGNGRFRIAPKAQDAGLQELEEIIRRIKNRRLDPYIRFFHA